MLDAKAALRAEAKERRRAAFAKHGRTAGKQIAARGLGFAGCGPDTFVSGFSAIRDEIDPRPLLERLHGDGVRLALPVMQGSKEPLVFRAWRPGDEMTKGVWGIAEPLAAAPAVEPDIVLVPLLAFDADGYRLGYGGGFYDRTLARLRRRKPIVAVGFGYDEQRVDAVPHLDYDQRLDWVLTPSGALRCSGP